MMEVGNVLVSSAGTGLLASLGCKDTLSPVDLSFETLAKIPKQQEKKLMFSYK